MKYIVKIILSLSIIVVSISLGRFLSDDKKEFSVVVKQDVFQTVSVNLCNEKAESLPFDNCNSDKRLQSGYFKNGRFATVRKIFLRHTCFVPPLFLNKHAEAALLIPIKAQPNYLDYTVNNLPLHMRNCIWLI